MYKKVDITPEFLRTINSAIHDEFGGEYVNPIPCEATVLEQREVSLRDRIRKILKRELEVLAESQEFETPEEADDFDVHDIYEKEFVSSAYEIADDEILNETIEEPLAPPEQKEIPASDDEEPESEPEAD